MDVDNLTFLGGVELADGSLFLGVQRNDLDVKETPHTLMRLRTPDGQWSKKGNGNWISTGVCGNVNGDGIALLGPEGEFLDLRLDGHTRNEVLAGKEDISCTLRFLKPIGDAIYAGGTNQHIFYFDGKSWVEIGVPEMRDAPRPRSFDGIAGFDSHALYAFGWKGRIWTNDGGQWREVESSTNVLLHDGDVHGGDVYIGGQLGTILKGRGDDWDVVENDILDQDIWSVRSFGDAVYFSMASGILRLKGGELEFVKKLGPDMRTAMSLFVGPSGLYSVGASDIVLFDGTDWHTIAQSE